MGGLGIVYGSELPDRRYIQPTDAEIAAIGCFYSGCSGAVVSSRCVLTATHCRTTIGDYFATGVDPMEKPDTEIFGAYSTDEVNFSLVPRAQCEAEWDLCLVRLNKRVPSSVRPLPVASATGLLEVSAVGFGQKGRGEPRFDRARTWTPGVIDWRLSTPQVLMVRFPGQRNICFGDSGGPLLAMVGGRLSIIGVLSKVGRGDCGRGRVIGVADAFYTRLDQPGGIEWVRRYSESLDGSTDCIDEPRPAGCPPPDPMIAPPDPMIAPPAPRTRPPPRLEPPPLEPGFIFRRPRPRGGGWLLPLGLGALGMVAALIIGRGDR